MALADCQGVREREISLHRRKRIAGHALDGEYGLQRICAVGRIRRVCVQERQTLRGFVLSQALDDTLRLTRKT